VIAALSLIFAFLLQAPPKPSVVVVGLLDGQQVSIQDPHYTGFIETRDTGDAVLMYREKTFHGEIQLSLVQRIDFKYRRGIPFDLGVTLTNGQKLEVQSDRRNFVMLKGSTDTGTITIKNPDPISPVVRLSTKSPNRKHELTIQYLEFPR